MILTSTQRGQRIIIFGWITKNDYFAGISGNPALIRYDAVSADPDIRVDIVNQLPAKRYWTGSEIIKADLDTPCRIMIEGGLAKLYDCEESIPITECP